MFNRNKIFSQMKNTMQHKSVDIVLAFVSGMVSYVAPTTKKNLRIQ